MKKGYGIFGRAFEIMLRNDVHAPGSIDFDFMENMILVEPESYDYLYKRPAETHDVKGHELFDYAQRFRRDSERETVRSVLDFTSGIALNYDVDFDDMLFGGTEKQIIERGTDWCADMARVGAVLLQCLGIPCRIVNAVNLERAYNGHVVGEAYYEGCYGIADFIYGRQFYDGRPLSAYDILHDPSPLDEYPEDYRGTFSAMAINEYDPMNPANDYTVCPPNEYTRKVIYTDHQDKWFMGEDQA